MRETFPRSRFLRFSLIAAAAALAAVGTDLAAGPPPPPLLFQDISAFSGGPVDFGAPTSDSEKATGAFVDVDGDGWDDLITLTGSNQPCGYFLNRPDGEGGRAFVPAPAGNGLDSGAAFARDGASITAGDVDGDGDEDLFIGCAFYTLPVAGENILLLNDGAGRFTDATAAAGLLDGNNTTAACVLFDMDLDGDLDLLTVNSNLPGLHKAGNGRTRLFRNQVRETGTLGFVDETAVRLPMPPSKGVWAAVAPDYDGDGDPDVLICRDIFEKTFLFRNDGSGWFTDVTREVGGEAGDDGTPSTFGDDSPNGMGVCSGDVNNDGWMDYYITDILTNPLYLGAPGGLLVERGATAGVRAGGVTWGCTFADFDLDGWVDLHVAGGDTYGAARAAVRPYLYRNRGDGTFDEVYGGSGLRHDVPLHREMGTAASDFDGDGRTDLLVVRAEGEPAPPYLYRNVTETSGRAWVTVEVRGNGTTSNRSAVGARVRVWPRDGVGDLIPGLAQMRDVESSTGRAGRSSLFPTFGLGAGAASVDVEVTWPRAGLLEARRDLYVSLPVGGRIVREDLFEGRQRIAPAAEAEVKAGTAGRVPVPGGEAPGGPADLRILEGPGWASTARDETGSWVLDVAPPVLDRALDVAMTLQDIDLAAGGLTTRQVMTLHVLPVPVVESCEPLQRGRSVLLGGKNFPPRRCQVFVDGIRSRRVKAFRRSREEDGDAVRLRVRVPLRGADRRGTHSVEVMDPRTGFLSGVFEYTVP